MHYTQIRIKLKTSPTKKFMNHPADMVEESLRALEAADPHLEVSTRCRRVLVYRPKKEKHELSPQLIQSNGKDHSPTRSSVVILEKPHQRLPYFLWGADNQPREKVALISGGGSGHEPFAAGFVGKGMLNAAVAGSIFASPPSTHILNALEETRSDAGCIIFVMNYTGDRLNFGLAAERFKRAGNDVRVVTVADDTAIEAGRVGPRGIAGTVLVIKVAGAMAEEMRTIDEIEAYTTRVAKSIKTLGVSLAPCSLPGHSPMLKLEADEMEVGLGIHGEAGRRREPMTSAKNIIDMMLKSLIGAESASRKIIMLNNMGSVSQLEMNVLKGEIINWCEVHNVDLVRLISGSFMTSLDGHGISLSVIDAFDDRVIPYIDSSSCAIGWRAGIVEKVCMHRKRRLTAERLALLPESSIESCLKDEDPQIRRIVELVCREMKAREHELNELDASAGDGDCGSTFKTAADAIEKSLKKRSFPLSSAKEAAEGASRIFENEVGGTSGAIYAMLLNSLASGLDDPSSGNIVKALDVAVQAVQNYGGARPGDRTMIDALVPAIELAKSMGEHVDWRKVADAARDGAESTTRMKAAAGRASYTTEDVQTRPDSGAKAAAYWISAIHSAVRSH